MRSFFGPLVTKNDPIFLKIKSGLALAPRNNNPKFQVDWLRNFDFIERKPLFRSILISFLATKKLKKSPIFLKIKSSLALALRNNNLKLQIDLWTNFDFNERKPKFWQILLIFEIFSKILEIFQIFGEIPPPTDKCVLP